MSKKITFSRLDQLRQYAEPRTGGDKPFSEKTLAEKAWTNTLHQVEYYEIYALDCIREMMNELKMTRNTTQSGIYASVANRIESGFKDGRTAK